MGEPLPPLITVRAGEIRRTFPPGRDVVVGRDVRADLRILHPAISRAHVILRCVDGQWTAVDNDSLNGMFVATERVESTPVSDGGVLHLGNPEGPAVTFELGAPPDERPSVDTKRPSVQSMTIGRGADADIGISDMLAARHHATLVTTPSGVQIQDANSVNGTFVNGEGVQSKVLQDNDIVTIGNVDFVFAAGTLVHRTGPATTTGGLEVRGVGLTLSDGDITLLDRVSLTVRPGALTAVIGPSGSGKSTLLKVIVGVWRPTSGAVKFDGRDLHAEYESLRSRIGMVPQEDAVHRGLTVAQALDIAAKLRMPPDISEGERRQVISRVLDELEMESHAGTRIDQLSGGQRKRVSIAMELLTEPSLLVLDEPTTGLDPALDQRVMTMLRGLADAGRAIVVVTHSLRFLDDCDQVLLLAPGGRAAYRGSPDGVGEAMGSYDWADIYHDIGADPEGAQRRFFERHGAAAEPVAQPVPSSPPRQLKRTSFWRQVAAVAQRQLQLVVADRRYLVFLVLAPIIVGLLPLAVGGDAGFTKPAAGSAAPFEPRQLVVLLTFGAVLMGLTLSVRDLVGERAIYRHEQGAGLSPSAYLLAKILVFSTVAVAQSALLVLAVTAPGVGKRAPQTAAVLGVPTAELFVDVAATASVAAILGLVISAVSRSSNQYIPLLAAACVAQLVLAGSLIPITGRPVLEVVAGLTPVRWGVAATASTIDLPNLVPAAHDPLWQHTASTWLLDIAMLGLLALVYAGFVRWRLRRQTDA
ncbi:ATP-binding cassette domain-containing protein [Mycobacterium sp. ITM-2016-00318]|uniref:ATP-binding cassette domain-containing protein n=1 Tax=Mycobacterium sp. ITM-2016-00318 TaxID=2099693 RepID=UPI000CF96928|nr:ATP-binding cassette domain-containing protein [Mycobacterium sp. ITM-2016-00318]WNG94395.1 ATP-binding cassette domain-containing protein [Mycobacterium sp. ITM-2016-00318]